MKITHIADLTEEELTKVMETGKILKQIAEGVEANEFILSEQLSGIVNALKDVLSKIK